MSKVIPRKILSLLQVQNLYFTFNCKFHPNYLQIVASTKTPKFEKGKDRYQLLLGVDRLQKGKRLFLVFHDVSADQGAISS
jgi:hypothetical protein